MSFPRRPSLALLAEYGAFEVEIAPPPSHDPMTQRVVEGFSDASGTWQQVWTVEDLPPGEIAQRDFDRSLTPPQFEWLLAFTGLEEVWQAMLSATRDTDRATYAMLSAQLRQPRFRLGVTLGMIAQLADDGVVGAGVVADAGATAISASGATAQRVSVLSRAGVAASASASNAVAVRITHASVSAIAESLSSASLSGTTIAARSAVAIAASQAAAARVSIILRGASGAGLSASQGIASRVSPRGGMALGVSSASVARIAVARPSASGAGASASTAALPFDPGPVPPGTPEFIGAPTRNIEFIGAPAPDLELVGAPR